MALFMTKIISILCIGLLLVSSIPLVLSAEQPQPIEEPPKQTTSYMGNAYRYNTQGWIYLYIEGDPFERGYQHGYLLADEIIDHISRWSNIVHNLPIVKTRTKFVTNTRYDKISSTWWNFCKSQINNTYWDKYPDEYKQEILGIAAGVNAQGKTIRGSKVNYQDILAINEMYEFLSKICTIRKGFHPIRDLINQLKQAAPELSSLNEGRFIFELLKIPRPHHCSAFIATGNATTDGQIVATDSMWCGGGSWWWTLYIAFRWNVILDINPTDGHRIIMASSPGFIWSDHDYYQNEDGIILLETTLHQGLWDNKGLPLAIRARTALQYGNNIDDVIDTLKTQNDGSMNAVWLIGDTKTGEIARFELGLYASGVYRTYDGFYWSANNPMTLGLRLEKMKLFETLYYHLVYLLSNQSGYEYLSPQYRPAARDLKFEELGNKYYGEIDIDVVKEIMATRPISGASTDCKLSDTHMIEQNGLWAFMGKLTEKTIQYTDFNTKKRLPQTIGPSGWVEIYGISPEKEYIQPLRPQVTTNTREPVWIYDTNTSQNHFIAHNTLHENTLYSTLTTGELIALDPTNGTLIWNTSIDAHPTTPQIMDEDILISTDTGLYAYNKNDGTETWNHTIKSITSTPCLTSDCIIIGTKDGCVKAYNRHNITGPLQWELDNNIPFSVYPSKEHDNSIVIAYGKNLSKINSQNGSIEWTTTLGGIITTTPLIYDNIVYIGSWDTFMYSLDYLDGSKLWSVEMGWGIDTIPAVTENHIYVTSMDHNIYKMKRNTGRLYWVMTTNAAIHSSPVVTDDRVFFGCDDGRFYACDTEILDLKWTFSPNQVLSSPKWNMQTTPIRSDPIIAGDLVIIGAYGNIYAFDASAQGMPSS